MYRVLKIKRPNWTDLGKKYFSGPFPQNRVDLTIWNLLRLFTAVGVVKDIKLRAWNVHKKTITEILCC